jgi:hypothetical protein
LSHINADANIIALDSLEGYDKGMLNSDTRRTIVELNVLYAVLLIVEENANEPIKCQPRSNRAL